MDLDTQWADLRSRSLDEALWFRSVLEAAGIEALIPDEHTLGLPLASETEPGTIRLLVKASDLERALELLAARPMPLD
jgi:Putative prokaryotic signal transducing protein